MKFEHVMAVLGLLFGTGGIGTGLFFWKKYLAEARKANADARKTEVDADKGEVEIRRLDTETAKLFREEFNATVREFREERRQIAAERAAERDQHKAELAAERAANQEVLRRKEEQFKAVLDNTERKLDETLALLEAERKAREADRIEFQAAIERCADESHKSQQQVGTIKSQLAAMRLQIELLQPLVQQMALIEAAIARIETSAHADRPSKDPVLDAPESEAQ